MNLQISSSSSMAVIRSGGSDSRRPGASPAFVHFRTKVGRLSVKTCLIDNGPVDQPTRQAHRDIHKYKSFVTFRTCRWNRRHQRGVRGRTLRPCHCGFSVRQRQSQTPQRPASFALNVRWNRLTSSLRTIACNVAGCQECRALHKADIHPRSFARQAPKSGRQSAWHSDRRQKFNRSMTGVRSQSSYAGHGS